MMIQKEKLTELSGMIAESGIYEAIVALQGKLKEYLRLKKVNSHNYAIQFEFAEIDVTITKMQQQLEDLKHLSTRWESNN
jgi:hypothetical protein